MKGIVFTEFLDMVEKKFGYDIVDKIIEESNLSSGGAYTAIGTYDYSEIVQLIANLSKETNIEIPILLKSFGNYMFSTFLKGYPTFFNSYTHAFNFLESIDKYIHVEVLKLYPDAALPNFETVLGDNEMKIIYRSERKMGDFAEGLIESALKHFGHKYILDINPINEDGSEILFYIKLLG